MQGIVDKLSSNFIIAAFIPSLAFVIGFAIIFSPIIPLDVNSSTSALGLEKFIPVFVFTAIIGFTLSSLNTFIYKTFEGYFLLRHFGFLRRRQQRQFNRLQYQLTQNEKRLDRVRKRLNEPPTSVLMHTKLKRMRDSLEEEWYQLATELDANYPQLAAQILPTRFGNALRAAESYSAYRYGIDGVPIWPRLVHVMPDRYFEKLELSNNGLAFLLNCSTLSFVMAALCFAACIHQVILAYCISDNSFCPLINVSQLGSITSNMAVPYLILGILMLTAFRGFYNAAIPVVGNYGDLVRSSYDLFRFDLLTALRLKLPRDSKEEFDVWRKISWFVTTGRRRAKWHFDYQVASDKQEDDNI